MSGRAITLHLLLGTPKIKNLLPDIKGNISRFCLWQFYSNLKGKIKPDANE